MNKEKKVISLSIRVKPSTKEALDKFCQKKNRSMSFVIEAVLRKFLGLR